jgi:phospholipid/cholesterol/gamma-HCH transport system substrate-binding protein
MQKNQSALKLGVFIFLGIALLVVAIFLIGDKDALFRSTFSVRAYFNDIQGLRSGATVRLSGIDVGSVNKVEITSDTTARVAVYMNLHTDIKRFIRTDTEASIETEGLVGNKVVVLRIGSSLADQVEDGGVIQSKEPLGFAAIIEETKGIMEYTKEMTKDLAEIIARVNKGEGSIGKLLTDEQLYDDATHLTRRADESLRSITDELNKVTDLFSKLGLGVESVVSNINKVVVDIDTIFSGVKDGKGIVGSLLVEGTAIDTTITSTLKHIQKTAEDSRLAASKLAENMEALKHNWLFKSYFENRGYWDKAEFEDFLDAKIQELDNKIKLLDDRITTLKSLEQ